MNLGQLQTRLGTLLKVKTKRYPLAIRTENINQAIRDLDDQFESWFSETTASWTTTAGEDGGTTTYPSEYDIDTVFAAPNLEFVSPIDVYYYSSDGAEVTLDQLSLEELILKYGSDIPDVVYPDGESGPLDTGAPAAFAIWDQKIKIRPAPDGSYTLYWKYRGKKRDLESSGDSNEWTTKEPYAVLYGAAVYGCIEILEESRAQIFLKMAESKISNISIRQSKRMNARRPVSEEPGATTGV